MKKGKKVLGIMIVSLLLIGSIVMVSAAFKDWFSFGDDDADLEGELAESAGAQLTVGGTDPVIVSWEIPDENGASAGTGFTPVCGTGVDITDTGAPVGLVITVSDADGCADLAEGDAVVTAYISKGTEERPDSASPVACLTSATAATCSETHERLVIFTCGDISMEYWDVNAADWIINIAANDDSSGFPATQISTAAGGNYPYLSYNQANCIILADGDDTGMATGGGVAEDTIAFGSISALDTLVGSDPNLHIYNDGNVLFDGSTKYLRITGQHLDHASTGDDIAETSFSVDPTEDCDQTGKVGLTTSIQNIPGGILPVQTASRTFGSVSQYEELFFCLESVVRPGGQVDSLDAGIYSTATGWDIGTST